MSRILAVDWGERHIGLAISDPMGIVATGLPTLTVTGVEDALGQVGQAARQHEATRIVVGLPLLLSGRRGEAAEKAERFANRLRELTGLPVDTYDERLTSALSARRLHEVKTSRRRVRERLDQGAAVALLEAYLTRRQSEQGSGS